MESITNNPNGKTVALCQDHKKAQGQFINYFFGIILLIAAFLFWNSNARATHVVGGGITYEKLDNDDYLLTVKLYRDCAPGNAQLPGNVTVQCRRGDGTPPAPNNFVLPLMNQFVMTPPVPACAFDPGVCVQEATYQATITLPPGNDGYHMYYSICCRNATIDNINNPLNARETFYAYIPDNGQVGNNDSPQFSGLPPVYVCAGVDLDLSFEATDADGDSLVYYFYTPYDGQNGAGITYGPGVPPNNINISTVQWLPGFGATDPLDPAPGLLPGLTIDNNGLIQGVPPMPGQYVVGVMVDEYRNGQLIGRVSRDFQFNVLNCPPPLEAVIDITTNCNGLTVDFLNQSTGIFNNSWWDFDTGNPADSSLAFQPSFTFPQAGSYNVTLIIEKGTECADTAVFTVNVMDAVNFNVDVDSVTCNGLEDGQALASSNDPNYVYNWSTQQQGNNIQNLAPGNYWVNATNDIGCIDTQYFLVEEPAILQIQFNDTEPLCFGDQNGSLEALVSGGNAPYQYYWSTQGYNGNPLNNIGSGFYSVDVTDANGCFAQANTNLGEPTALYTNLQYLQNVSCHGMSDGAAQVGIFGGTPGYTIDWLTLPNDSTYMNNLSAGNYIAEITDANGCLEVMNVQITEPDSFYVDVVIINNETCTGANGQAFADVTYGVGQISFSWTPTGDTTDFISGLSAGPISVTATDENGCTAQDNTIIIDQPTGQAYIGDIQPVSCQGGSDGSIEVLMNGGTPQFNYQWSCQCPNQNTANNLSAGSYWVAVSDDNGCVDTLDFVIDELPPVEVSIIQYVSPTCNGLSDGFVEAEAIGGTVPYNYEWDSNPAQYASMATNLPAGTYNVTVTDSNGCQGFASVDLIEPAPLTADIQILGNNICYGDSSGVAQGQGVGGVQPYTYAWSTGDSTAIINDLPAGFYDLTVTDFNGCQAFNTVEIIEYDSVYAEIQFDDGFCPGDQVDFWVATNGLNNQYDFYWYVDHILEGTSNTFQSQIFDTSEVTIVLVNTGSCPSVVDSTWVGPIMMPNNNVSVFATPDTICYGSSAMLEATLLDSSNISSITWNVQGLSGLGPHEVYPPSETDYIVTIENVCGAQQSDTAHVNVFMPPSTEMFAVGTSGCERIEVQFDYDYDENYVYQFEGGYWNIGGTQYGEQSPIVAYTNSVNEDVTLNLAFSNGCIFSYDTVFAMTVYSNPEGDFYYNPTPALENELTEFIDITFGNTQAWEWYVEGNFISNDERPSYVFEQQGEYEVTQIVTDENGCMDTTIHIVEVIGSYNVFVPNAFTPDGNGVNNTFKPIVNNVDPNQYRFMIFNRWGEKIFETEVIDNAWDGTYLDDNVRDGVYIWKVLVTDNVGIEHEHVGHVTLLR